VPSNLRPTSLKTHPLNHGFTLKGTSQAILCVHGYSATPQTFSELGPFLHKKLGFQVHAPVLPGHGTHFRDMDDTPWVAWTQAVSEVLSDLKQRFSKVHLVGLSMGGTLCHYLGQKHPSAIASINLMAPGLRFHKPWIHKLMHLIKRIPEPVLRHWVRHKPDVRLDHITYPSYSMLSAVIAFNFFDTCEKTSQISKIPCLIQTPYKDKAVDPISSEILASFYADGQLLKITESGHIMVCAPAKDLIFENILNWIQKYS